MRSAGCCGRRRFCNMRWAALPFQDSRRGSRPCWWTVRPASESPVDSAEVELSVSCPASLLIVVARPVFDAFHPGYVFATRAADLCGRVGEAKHLATRDTLAVLRIKGLNCLAAEWTPHSTWHMRTLSLPAYLLPGKEASDSQLPKASRLTCYSERCLTSSDSLFKCGCVLPGRDGSASR